MIRLKSSRFTQLIVFILLCSVPLSSAARKDDRDKRKKEGVEIQRPTGKLQMPRVPTTREPRATKPVIRKPAPGISHDRYYSTIQKQNDYRYLQTYRYHTRMLAPIPRIFYPIGFRITVLPSSYIRIVIGSLPYFYYDGIYYQSVSSGYMVVQAPIGARVRALPTGFIFFSLGVFTYYYVNHTYYVWDEETEVYVVTKKPTGADKAITSATANRLFVYPKKGQSEEQQAKDRYACHRWAVKETGVDPIENEDKLGAKNKSDYRRAITACLEGRGYTVK